ncbi:CHAD domain-containing protein [Pseudomonas panipatensis]|uniref:CHAD domain-containing protein n=1 Tax=Pseudomonas panipatensis TaxID=428992 RepID=A0A1G8FS77_9PSED|nr:CHAD domain-containing protein [Pseudomonas panipatensis]SDH84985.1 CHAD domain-containing protein [Pseudomonas panipatensis]SMP52424.1 CHAD domain-containing protein [Pseudomonas panipatensis]
MSRAEALIERLFAAEVAFLHALARSAALTDAEALHDLRLSLRHLRGLLWPLREDAALADLDRAALALLRQTSALRDTQVLSTELSRLGLHAEAGARQAWVEEGCQALPASAVVHDLLRAFDGAPPALRQAVRAGRLKGLKGRLRRHLRRQWRSLCPLPIASPEEQHVTRLRVKRLRYLQASYPRLMPMAEPLKALLQGLQSALGDAHDLDFWCRQVAGDPALRPALAGWREAKAQAVARARILGGQLEQQLGSSAGRVTPARVPALRRVDAGDQAR